MNIANMHSCAAALVANPRVQGLQRASLPISPSIYRKANLESLSGVLSNAHSVRRLSAGRMPFARPSTTPSRYLRAFLMSRLR